MNEARAVDKLCTPEAGKHRNIVTVFKHGKLRPSYYHLDMELCDLNLQHYIERKWTPAIQEKMPYFTVEPLPMRNKRAQIWDIMEDITSGLAFIHLHKEIHRDLKPRNSTRLSMARANIIIVLYSHSGEVWKIADFGLTTEGTSKKIHRTVYARGTSSYRAPELVEDEPTYTNKVDIWSLGCILSEIVFREKAFTSDFVVRDYAQRSLSTGERLLLPRWTDTLPDETTKAFISKLIYEMLDVNAHKRPGAAELHKRFVG